MPSLGFQDLTGNWIMVCGDCGEDIKGTISGEGFVRAHLHNINRGGIKCPACREQTCPMCHHRWDGFKKFDVCWFCEMDPLYLSSIPYLNKGGSNGA